jgi:hypothetical protein
MNHAETPRPFWRQGDIFFVQLDGQHELHGGKPVKTGIIARGEETGHMHRISPSSLADGAALVLVEQSMYLRSPEAGATIVHNEHGPIQLPAGIYAVLNQREFDGLDWRKVID